MSVVRGPTIAIPPLCLEGTIMTNADLTPRILITRLSAIGDCILTLPLACALRDHFPKALLAWVVEPLAATVA